MQSEIPEIPGYEIYRDKLLGEGGFAKVYLARHKAFQIDVALKIMDSELAKDPEFCKRFIREGRTCAKLGVHANIMNIYDIGCVDDSYYFSMQLLGGSSLQGVLENQGLESDRSDRHPLKIIRPIAEALGFAHRHGFVHRDIKPANILFNEDGVAMLSDFGIAKSHNQHTLSAIGAAIGTPAYMSPEQAKASEEIDGRSDLYSLGVVLFEMLAGRQPYKSDTPMGTMLQHVNDPIPLLPDHQKKFQPLINRLMAKDPADRYRDSEALLVDIDWHIANYRDEGEISRIWDWGVAKIRQWRVPVLALVTVLALVSGSLWLFKTMDFSNSDSTQAISDKPSDNSGSTLSAETEQITELLSRAALYEAVGDLVAPPGSNALEIYEEILSIEPNQAQAVSRKSELLKLLE